MPRSASIRPLPRRRARRPERRAARLRMQRSGSIRGLARTPRRHDRSMCDQARRRQRTRRSGSIRTRQTRRGQRRPRKKLPRVLRLRMRRSGSISTPTRRRRVASISRRGAPHRAVPARTLRLRQPPGPPNDRQHRRALMTASRRTVRCGRRTMRWMSRSRPRPPRPRVRPANVPPPMPRRRMTGMTRRRSSRPRTFRPRGPRRPPPELGRPDGPKRPTQPPSRRQAPRPMRQRSGSRHRGRVARHRLGRDGRGIGPYRRI